MLSGLVGLFLPQTCMLCGATLNNEEREVCRHCLDRLPSTHFETWPDNPMMRKMEGRVNLTSAFGAYYFRNGEGIRNLIHLFKYMGDSDIAIEIGRELGRRAMRSGFIKDYDVLVPVPLHEKKIRKRGYNQAEKIAKGLAEVTHLELRTDVLIRNKYKNTQTLKNNVERFENVKRDFVLGEGAKDMVGKRILLVDDVFTTGATSESCLVPISEIEGVRMGICTVGYVG